jgi:hypothetical protein
MVAKGLQNSDETRKGGGGISLTHSFSLFLMLISHKKGWQ